MIRAYNIELNKEIDTKSEVLEKQIQELLEQNKVLVEEVEREKAKSLNV